MTRQETIDALQDMLDVSDDLNTSGHYIEALEKAIKVLSEMSNDEFEYLTFPINKGELSDTNR